MGDVIGIRPPSSSSMLDHALFYARRGWKLAPFFNAKKGGCSCEDGPQCPQVGKHPRIKNWKERATTDAAEIRGWWSRDLWVHSNINIITGADTGLVVLDLDGDVGRDTLRRIEEQFEALPKTPRAVSGGGGLHLYFKHPQGGIYVASGTGLLGPKGDVKADGGSIMAPPSHHKSGRQYAWELHPADVELANLPEWLHTAIDKAHMDKGSIIKGGRAPVKRTAAGGFELPAIVSEGNRADMLYKFGCSLRAKGADEKELQRELHDANDTRFNPPLDRKQVDSTINSVMRQPQGQRKIKKEGARPPDPPMPGSPQPPRGPEPSSDDQDGEPPTNDANATGDGSGDGSGSSGGGGGSGNGGGDGGGEDGEGRVYTPNMGPDGFAATQMGNAQRLRHRFGDDLLFCSKWQGRSSGGWLLWDGTRWLRDEEGFALNYAKSVARKHHLWFGEEDWAAGKDKGLEKKWASFIKESESYSGLNCSLSLARTDPTIAVRPEHLDADCRDVFNTLAGTLDLYTWKMRPHKREDFITKVSPVPIQRNATCTLWTDFLYQIMGGDDELVSFLQRAVGYSLTGRTDEQCLFFLWGGGSNGKSTFLETIRKVAGDYGKVAEFRTFIERDSDQVRNDIAALFGARLVTATEPGSGKRFDEGMLKSMTGSDTIQARFMHAEFFEYKPQFKLWLGANHKPTIRGNDDGIWRRFRLVPFSVKIPDDKQDKTLQDKLDKELPGILRWALDGARAWYEKGLNPPEKVLAATESYRAEQDALGQFIRTCCHTGDDHKSRFGDLYNQYKKWCESAGERYWKKRTFGTALRERGFNTEKISGASYFVGISLAEEEQDEAPAGALDGPTQPGLYD